MSDISRLRKFHKDVPAEGDRLNGPHLELGERIQQIVRFRHGHESLRSVITKVTKSSQASGQRGSGLSNLQLNALEVRVNVCERAYLCMRAYTYVCMYVLMDGWIDGC